MIKKTYPAHAPKVAFDLDGRIMHSDAKTEAVLLTLKPGEFIPAHTNPFDVLFIGISGQATITAGDQTFTMEPCETLFISGEELRQMQNQTGDMLKIMVMKVF
jgi:quercetin dioxygenase-like cupin family protein